jgi:hypothetical protein
MKTKITALLLATVAALALVPKQAVAGDKEAALIGGLIGGLVIGSALHDSRPYYGDTTVVVHDGYGYDRGYAGYEPAGYWDYRTVRVWVPATWEFRWVNGHQERVLIAGHWAHRRERHWVAHRGGRYDRHGRNDSYDRHDRRHDRRDGHGRW